MVPVMKSLTQHGGVALLPTYHLLVERETGFVYGSTREQLESHLRILSSRRDESEKKVGASVTFDDGHASQHRYAFPLLQKYGIKAIFFCIAGKAGKCPDYMKWAQMRELAQAGHEVQSHGLTHCFLTQCTNAKLEEELYVSKTELEQHLGISVDAISIPFGRWNKKVLLACADAGYKRIYTSDPRPPSSFEGRAEVLGRFMVRRSTTVDQLTQIVEESHKALLILRAKHECKLLLRSVIGDGAYHRLWGLVGSRKSLEEVGKEY
jgi:peptidoglycan/xylan/chitin deacetylase (PgdA/CDA1 family)